MKHYGKHEFPQLADINTAKIFNGYFNNKLNIPLHRDVTDVSFGDVFVESNAVKFVNFEKYITELLSLNNNDLIKSLLLSEIFFDYFMNYGQDRTSTESFNEDINLINNLIQYESVDYLIDMTAYDSTIYPNNICIELYNFNTTEDLVKTQNLINGFIEYNLSLRCKFYNDTTQLFESMILYNVTNYDMTNAHLELYTDNTNVNPDITNANKIKIYVYNIEETNNVKYMILPPHKHLVNELSDLDSYTNVINGFIRLINDNNIRLPFDQYLWLVQSKIENSLFIKEWVDEFKKSNCFNAEYNTTKNTYVNYSSEDVVMGDQTVTEYTYIDMTIDFEDVIDFRLVSNNWKLNNKFVNSIYDTTGYQTKYLCEFLHINLNNIVNSSVSNIEEILDVTYTQIDKTDVDSNLIKVYDLDLNLGTLDIFNGYYNVNVLQASPSTIPSVVMTYTNLCKDSYNNVFVTKPLKYNSLTGKITLNILKDSDVLFKYDDENSSMNINVYKFNIFKSEQESFITINASSSVNNTIYKFDRGIYEFRPSNLVDVYNVYVLERV